MNCGQREKRFWHGDVERVYDQIELQESERGVVVALLGSCEAAAGWVGCCGRRGSYKREAQPGCCCVSGVNCVLDLLLAISVSEWL